MSEPLPTRAVESEKALLAACLADPSHFHQVRTRLSDEDFYVPQHREIWQIIRYLDDSGGYDSAAVHETLVGRGRTSALQALLHLVGAWGSGSVDWHAARLRNASVRRALLQASQRLNQEVDSCEDPIALTEQTINELRLIQTAGLGDEDGVLDVHDVFERTVDEAVYVVPGLLARYNRIIITAPEGWGKSSLLRQIGVCSAAGVHPFKPKARIRPVKALIVDAENPPDINTIEYARLKQAMVELESMPRRGMLLIQEAGEINLLDGRQAAKLAQLVEREQPELILLGPIYNLHDEDPNDERAAKHLSRVLNRLRYIGGAAMVLEAHTPHNDGPQGQILRPYGASLWKRWPEFGYCLHPVVKQRAGQQLNASEQASVMMRESFFTGWRGPRAARRWPARLGMGGTLPWEEYPG